MRLRCDVLTMCAIGLMGLPAAVAQYGGAAVAALNGETRAIVLAQPA